MEDLWGGKPHPKPEAGPGLRERRHRLKDGNTPHELFTTLPGSQKSPGSGSAPGLPIYVDLAYIPNHCSAKNVDQEFFKRVRSAYYAGKDSSCMTTVLLEARTIRFSSCCLSWVCWYQSRVTSLSWVGIR
ncbi:unnamed protein product, partial [Menidia menidia]